MASPSSMAPNSAPPTPRILPSQFPVPARQRRRSTVPAGPAPPAQPITNPTPQDHDWMRNQWCAARQDLPSAIAYRAILDKRSPQMEKWKKNKIEFLGYYKWLCESLGIDP